MKYNPFLPSLVTLSVLLMTPNIWATTPTTGADESFNNNQIEQIKHVVHDYLVTNPQVLVEASQSLQKQESIKAEQQARSVIAQQANQIFANPSTPVGGNAKGNITLVEFFDYQCPHCKDMGATLAQLIKESPELRVVYKELPIFGEISRNASAAALAAAKQGNDKYLKMHDALLSASNPLDKNKLMSIAASVGLDTNRLAKDMKSPAIQKQIEDNFHLAQALNLVGTPTFIVSHWTLGGVSNSVKEAAFIPGMPSLSELRAKVEQAKSQSTGQ